MVEFAIILPIFLILVFGMIEFSILFYDKAVITNASREGARLGTMYREMRPPIQEIRDRVKSYCQTYLITFQSGHVIGDSDIALTVNGAPYDPATFKDGDVLNVEVRYPYTFLVFPNIAAILGGADWRSGINLVANSQMRGE